MRLFKLTVKYNGKTFATFYPFPQDVIIKLAERYSPKSFDIHIEEV